MSTCAGNSDPLLTKEAKLMPRIPRPTPPSPTPRGSAPAGPAETPLPNERDESSGATAGVPSRQVQQAHRDLQRGVRDTDRGPPADEAYRKLKR